MESETTAVVVRSDVPPEKDYQKYRQSLRWDFFFSCSYCSITEVEAGGIGFEIDHYWPSEHFPECVSKYDNLMYSCEKCNGLKGDFYHNEDMRNAGIYTIRVDEEDPSDHLIGGELLDSKTKTGEFNISLFDLNSRSLQRVRRLRHKNSEILNEIMLGMSQLSSIKIERAKKEKRPLFARMKKEMLSQGKDITGAVDLDELLREVARSPLLDLDPDRAARMAKRRKYLKKQKAISPFV